MSSRNNRGHHVPSSGASSSNPTYATLASLRDKLRSTKITERRSASKELLEKLQDSSTLRKLECEAERGFDNAMSRSGGGGGGSGRDNDAQATLPWERVCILYRSLMDAALLASRTVVEGGTNSEGTLRGKKRSHANQTGFTKKSCKFNADDVLFPYKVFLRMDMDQSLECNDGGYSGDMNVGWEEDWKTRPKYGHHVDVASCIMSSSSSANNAQQNQHGRYSATHYTPHTFTDRNRGSRLSSKEIIACVDYCIHCLNDDDCCNFAETSLLQWLIHICSRPEYLAALPYQHQLSHVLHELSIRLNRAFLDGNVEERGILPSVPRNKGKSGSGYRQRAIPQQSLLAVSKCLSAMVYNCTTRLGMGMHLYIRPVIELVAVWAENAWQLQSEGEFASSSEVAQMQPPSQKNASSSAAARNPHHEMLEEGLINPSSIRRKLRTEADILSLLPYLYSSVTHLLAAHPEHSIPILSDHGHALLRLVRRNYARPTTNLQTRDALTEYVSAHLLVAETSGKVCGLPEGDVGPLVPRLENEDDDQDEEGEDGDDGGEGRKKKKSKKGATLDAKQISKLLEMIRNEKVWEGLFSPAMSGQDAKKKKSRKSLTGRKHGRSGGGGISLPEGGASWTPLTRRQRRHLELMARLVRISQRLYLAEAEDRGNGTVDSLESLIEHAEEMMQCSGIEHGEIDIQPKDGSSSAQQPNSASSGDMDERHVAATSALACSPMIRMVCRHLYKLNPKLGRLVSPSSLTMHASFTQDTMHFTQGNTQFTQAIQGSSSQHELGVGIDGEASCERILLESCPMLQALMVDESTLAAESSSALDATMTQGTLIASLTAPTPTKAHKNDDMLDSIRPTTTATLQFLCACAESFPRGECWASSTRQYWSTILDDGPYPTGTLANMLERHGSSPADAAAVVYLLGTTLESHGGSGGEDDIQLWTLVTLLKMTESSAIICSREGLSNAASFGSPSSLGALRVAWQYVWKLLFRYDLRYSSFTSGAFGNNVGELVLQLLTQIVRYQCVDRKSLFVCRPSSALGTSLEIPDKAPSSTSASARSPFVHGEQGQLWKLPVFENASSILSCAPFELIANVVQYAGFSDTGQVAALATAASSMQMANSAKDRPWFVSFCLRFIESAMEDTTESRIRRTFLPFAATCLASLISDGGITSDVSTFELDGLTRFAITEDSEPLRIYYDPDNVEVGAKMGMNQLYTALWSESITPDEFLKGVDQGLSLRIVQGRGALLNKHLNAQYERYQLRNYMNRYRKSYSDAGISPQRNPLGGMVFEKVKSFLDELVFQLKYEDGNASDEDEKDSVTKDGDKRLALPQLTGCLSLILTVLLSKHSTANQISDNLVGIFKDTFGPTIDILVDNMASLKGCPSDFLAVFTYLHGIVRVLTFVAAFGGGEAAIPRIFGNQGKSLFIMCKSLLKVNRNEACTLEASNQAAASMSGDLDSDSEDDHRAQTQRSQTQRFSRPSNFSDDSDGLMDDEDDENRDYRPKKQRAPPVKRRRIGNGSMSRAKKSSSQDSRSDNSIDSRGAWACASFMLVLQPSFKSVELISGHLVWPEDYNNQAGYGTVSKTPDPFGALVCATLFCQKSVILRRDRLDLQSERGEDEDEDQESALILSIETILQARRSFLPPSKHFMCGLGLVAGYIRIGDYSESCGPIGVDESKMVLEALYPEGVGKESDDYFLLRQWTKRILKYRTSYRSQQAHAGTLAFLYAQTNLIAEFGDSFGSYFMYASFRHIDENMRSLACDVLGAALIKFSDQTAMVTDVMKNAIPPTNRKKFKKWVNEIADQKLRDELTNLEDEALSDAEDSIKYHSIECIGMIAGSVSDAALGRDLIWKLIDLAAKQPPMLLPCYRACKRASFLLGFKSLGDMFDGMMPHFLVKWLESQRSLREFPLLLMSPFALERACQYLPNELLSMLSSGKGWTEDFFHLDEIEGESQTLNERVLTSYIESVAKFLIPNILLSASDDLNNDGASKYLKEVVIILTGVDSDENVAKVLCNHIADLYGFVAVLAENGDATLECENAFKFLKRCVSSVHIERTGAKCAFLVLRHILLLHCKGISVVGLRNIELTSSSFIEGMKYVAKQLKAPSSNRKQATFLEQLGSSMTESIILVKYWLSSSLTARQRNESWGTLSLLYDILATENIQSGKIESGELGFCLHSFIAIVLDPKNNEICPQVLESLKVVLGALFSNTTKDTLVDGAIAVVHKLCLVLLQIHQRAYEKLYTTCVSALCCLEYEQKASQGLLSGIEDRQNSADSLGEAPWRESSKRDDILKHLIASKADIEERVSSDTMLMSYGCLEVIAKSGKMQLEDILGAEDIVLQCDLKEEVFRSVNEKYSMLTFFNSIQQQSTKTNETNLDMECEHFIRIMNEHPISSDEFDSATTYSSHAVLARLLALRRLQKALLAQDSIVDTNSKSHGDVYPLLLNICHSGEPEESRLISSRCLGELKLVHSSTQKQECTSPSENESLYDLLSKTIIAHLGQYLLSECADTSLVAMKTAKALLVTPAGKEVWQSLDGDIKGLLSPFNTVDDGKLRREAVRISDGCLERLKSISGSSDSGSWCWNDELWTCLESEESSSDLWIRNITCSIISCCFGKGSKVAGRGLDFRICQGLCAMEANFAATVFPALIFHLLDSEARDSCKENGGVQDVIMSNIAIGSPTSGKNKVISRCFSRLLSPKSNLQVIPPQAIAAVLNTLELIRAITEHRFLTSPEHVKNKSNIAQKQSSSDKKRRSCNASDTADINALESSPKWRGFPYGVVLRVSGLDVAKACFRVKRYYSALYYAEMSMQNLIGSGTFFEDFANDSPLKHGEGLVCDISGFGVLSQKEEISGGKTVLEQALVAKDIIGRCLSEIHAKDELQGVLSQGSALDLKQNITSLATLDGCRRDQTYSMLLDLDNGLQTIAKPGVASIDADSSPGFSTIASCLEDLGLNHVKRHYLAGVENRLMIKGQTDDRSKRYLREKWFQDSLNKTFQWDDTLLPQVNDGELPAVVHETLRNSTDITHGAPPSFTSQPVANFYESVHEALQSFAKNDVTAGLGNLGQARKSVLAELEFLAGSEAQSTGMVTHLIKLNTLGQLELVARTLDGKSSLAFLLNRWGFFDSAGGRTLQSLLLNDEVNFDVKEQGTNIDGALFSSIRTELFSVKEIALKVLANKFSSQEGIANALTSHIYKSCSIYRELGHPEAAKVSLSSLRSLIQKSEKTGHASGKLPLMLRLDDAKIMKSQDNLEGAIMTCRMIATHLNNATNYSGDIERDQICAESLLLGGLWMAENNVDSAETILSSFFEKAAGLAMRIHKKAPSSSSAHRASISSFKLGEFAANLHNSVDARISSEAWKRRLVVATERKRELEAVTAQVTKLQKKSRSNNEVATMDARIIHATLAREVDMDDREIESVQKSIQRYLYLAVESYCSALKLCPTTMTDGVSKHVFQLVSLWFKNCQRKETKDVVNELLKSNLSQIPTYRLVPLTYQLFSRIDEMQKDDSNGFQITLRDIVLKICSEHPYHGIVQILALSNGQRIGGGVNGRHANAYLENIGTTKVDAVNDIIQELRKQSSEYVSALIDSYRILMTAYMNLAEFDTTNVQKRTTKGLSFKQYKLDLDCCLSGGRRGKRDTTTTNMPAIFTKPPPIRPDAQYGNGTEDPIGTERVVSFEPNFDLTLTGLHRPKIVKCIGSRGNRFKQLVKGEDDLRQDAIMQQVFGTVNDLLRHEGSSGNDFIKKSLGSSIVTTRQLRVITYGITPLSPASGVLEWVDNTMCFGDFLTDKTKKVGAHSKYFPGEWGNTDVREFYRNAGEARNATPESKRKAFDKICENFSPAFRFFFLEYFNSSMEAWHTARTLYTRSCAVNSIVGHILGIGDRHTSNILVHTKTGEVVHIDFGIVFDQGKTLTTPELVPFRLTRDLVDGMGPSGTDGVFSKAAEATMGVMRNNADTLLTILSAVVSDPLYKWSLSPLKVNQHQRNNGEDESRAGMPSTWMSSTSDENRNDAADRAIAKIHEKLEGYEDGTSGEHKTVAGQVKLLINEARDPSNLCMMFSGWAPWM